MFVLGVGYQDHPVQVLAPRVDDPEVDVDRRLEGSIASASTLKGSHAPLFPLRSAGE